MPKGIYKHKKQSKETILKRIESRKRSGWWHTPKKTREKRSKSMTGNTSRVGSKNSDEHNKRIADFNSINMLGKKNALGHRLGNKTKDILREYRAKQRFSKVSSGELKLRELLDILGISYIPQYMIRDKEFLTFVDVYIPEKNLCIYYDGDYWHGLEQRIEKDRIQNKRLVELGYKVFRIREGEFVKNNRSVLVQLKGLISNKN
jgi:very-short-patch-repair endonuclease